MSINDINIAERIREALFRLRWNQSELARAARLSRSFVSEVISGARRPSQRVLDTLAQAGIDMDWLLGDAPSPVILPPEIVDEPHISGGDDRHVSGSVHDAASTLVRRLGGMPVWDHLELHCLLVEALASRPEMEQTIRGLLEGLRQKPSRTADAEVGRRSA